MVVRDQGDGFDPEALADPLAPENLLKSSGRGIFFMRSFMDDVQLARLPEGGMEVRMVKRLAAESWTARRTSWRTTRAASPPPSTSSCAPARSSWRTSTATSRIDKKGAIDLVTEADLEVEQHVPARCSPSGFRRTRSSPRSWPRSPGAAAAPDHCWVFDPIDGTTNYAHGLPIFCASLGLEIDGRVEIAAVYDPTRRELFTAERGGGAYLNGAPLRVSAASSLIEALLVTGIPVRRARACRRGARAVRRRSSRRARAVRRLGSAALDMA
ncbi:MAG: ATP-binding protein [Ignavibacteriales bacterium]|nr:ATP-binding protein [Ignavibacteriales bacterium]